MGDRRPFSLRFWSSAVSSSPRRNPTTQTTTSPPSTTTTSYPTPPPKVEPQNNRQSTASNATATSANSLAVEIETQTSQSTTTTSRPPTAAAQPTTPPSSEVLTIGPNTTPTPPALTPSPTSPPSSTVRPARQSTSNASARSTSEPEPEPQTSSPSRATNRSPPASKPASPSRGATQSNSLSQPFSPSRATPQARSTPSSPSRAGSQTPSTPQRPSQPRSPSRPASNSPKQTSPPSTKGTQPTSPSKESLSTTQEISNGDEAPTALASNEKEPKTAASQEEPQPKEDVKSDSAANDFSPIQKLDSSTINDGHKPLVETNAKPEETKEVVQVANTKANKETQKENDFVTPKSGSGAQIIERVEHLSKPAEKQEALDTKEILPSSLPNAKPNSQPKNIRSMISDTHKKSALPSGENVPLHKEIKEDITSFVNKLAIADPKRAIYDKPVSLVTLAGENRGALMEMGSNSSKRERTVHIHRGYKLNPDESAEATTDGEGSSKGEKSKDGKATKDQPTEAYVNNNGQGVNNSILFNSSVAERNPGVHMVVNHVQKEPIELTDRARGFETRKAEFNITRADKLTYEPTVRRRCLEGLFLETSDSDQENPEKPRRHGCRVGCKEKGKEKDIDVL